MESSGRWEGTLTRGWAARILRQSVEGTAVMKVSVGTVPGVSQPQACREAPLSPRPSFGDKPEIPHLGTLLGCSQAVAAALFLSAGPHSRLSRVSMDIQAGFHSVSSALAVLIPPASL